MRHEYTFENIMACRDQVADVLGPHDLQTVKVVLGSITAQALALECRTPDDARRLVGALSGFLEESIIREITERQSGAH